MVEIEVKMYMESWLQSTRNEIWCIILKIEDPRKNVRKMQCTTSWRLLHKNAHVTILNHFDSPKFISKQVLVSKFVAFAFQKWLRRGWFVSIIFLLPFLYFYRQEAYGPHCSPEKTVPINKYIFYSSNQQKTFIS